MRLYSVTICLSIRRRGGREGGSQRDGVVMTFDLLRKLFLDRVRDILRIIVGTTDE